MAKLTFCAGLGIFSIISSVVLVLFVQLTQATGGAVVLRHLQMSRVSVAGLGTQLASAGVDTTSLYGTGPRSGDNTGLREYYSYGIWNSCEANSKTGTKDVYCEGAGLGRRFTPYNAIIADAPTESQAAIANSLGSTNFTKNKASAYTHAASYLIFIGGILAAISLFTAILAHRFAFLISAVTGLLAVLFIGVGAALWTSMVVKYRHAVKGTGIHVSYGNGIWMAWASAGAALISVVPFLLACCFGGSRRPVDDYDEKY